MRQSAASREETTIAQQQDLLLQAILMPEAVASKAATKWLATIDIDALDPASMFLVPLFSDRIRQLGIDHPLFPTLSGIKKYFWYKNQVLIRRTGEAIGHLRQAGIEVMALKGLALATAYYRNVSHRPMSDGDLLVRYEDAPKALELLYELGWRPESHQGEPRSLIFRARDYTHSIDLCHPTGERLDLHFHALHYSFGEKQDLDFWSASKEIAIDSVPARMLCPADQLLHIFVHGASWNQVAPIRWITDARSVINATPDLDWERLVTQTKSRRLSLPVSEALECLQHKYGVNIPPEVGESLRNSKSTFMEKREFRYLRTSHPRFWERSLFHLYRYARISKENRLSNRKISLRGYFYWHWDASSITGLSLGGCRKIMRMLRESNQSHLKAPRVRLNPALSYPIKTSQKNQSDT